MTLCGPNKPQRYNWNKTVSNKTTKHPIATNVIRETYGYNTKQSLEAFPLLSDIVIMTYAEDLGLQKDSIAKLKKELKNR